MASIRISQLAEVTAVTNDDVFVINDGDINTRKITYTNLTAGLVPQVGNSNITGDLTISGLLTAGDLEVASGLISVDTVNQRVGIGTTTPGQKLDVDGNVQIRGGNRLRLMETNSQYAVTLQAPALTASSSYALPATYPSASGQILASSTSGEMSWATAFVDPLTTVGDMIYRNVSNATSRLAIGSNGQVLTVQADGTANWQNPTSGFTDPMTNAGDIILRDGSNTTTRLGVGSPGQVLKVAGTGNTLTWAAGTSTLAEVTAQGSTTTDNVSVGYDLVVQGVSTNRGQITLNCETNAHGVTIKSPPHSAAASYTLTLPNDDGTTGQVLSTDGSGVLSWIAAGGNAAASSFTWDASMIPDTNEAYDLGSASFKVRHLFLSNNSIKFEDGDLGVSGGELTWKGTAFTPSGGGSGYEVKPVVTAVNPVAVNQGEQWSATQVGDTDLPPLSWSFYDYTGTAGTFNRASSAGTVVGIENTPGTYTIKARAAWPFGISDPVTLTVQVNVFNLNRTTMFGGVDGLQGYFDASGSSSAQFIAVTGAAVDNGTGNYVWDADGSVQSESANCIAFYEYTLDVLYCFNISDANVVEGVYRWPSVTTLPTQGVAPGSSYGTFLSYTSQKDAAINSSVLGKRVPAVAQYTTGMGSQHYLVLTPSGSEFNNFGGRNADWSYGFRLQDDWMAGAYGNQMLSPSDTGQFFLNTINGLGIGSGPYENVIYGDDSAGPYSSGTNGASWDISAANWKIGSAGDLVVVTYDGTSTNTWKVYVEGTLIYSSSSVYIYMPTTSTPTTLEFGNFSRSSGVTNYIADYNDPSGWYSRLDYLFVSVGTAYDQSQVTELTADKADLTGSDNYASITTLGTFDESGITNTKGTVAYSRGDFSF